MGNCSGELAGVGLVGAELGLDGAAESAQGCEVAVVGGVLAGLAPHHFDRVELWAVRRQVEDCETAGVCLEERREALCLVEAGVVEDEEDFGESSQELDDEGFERAAVELLGAAELQMRFAFQADGAEVLAAPLAGMVVHREALATFGPAAPNRAFLLETATFRVSMAK